MIVSDVPLGDRSAARGLRMGWMGFLSSLVSSLAWPALVLAAILIFQKPLADLISRIRAVSVGNVKVDISQLAAEVNGRVPRGDRRPGWGDCDRNRGRPSRPRLVQLGNVYR